MIVFCTTCKNRTPHLEQTLPRNLLSNAGHKDTKFIILNYNSGDHLVDWLAENCLHEIADGRVVLYTYREPGPFRMAHAKNMAHRLGALEGGTILVNLDADNLTGENFAAYVDEQLRREHVFMYARMIKDQMPRGISGRIAVSHEAFLLSGGYNEKYDAWSPDDKDFNVRLRRLGYDALEIESKYLDGIRHNDRMRFKEYPHLREYSLEGEEEFTSVNSTGDTVVNYGNVGCGTVYKNFSSRPIAISPEPTRVFGIGLHKTGTTSLFHALGILGMKCAHWPSAHWAKSVWLEMITMGKSLTLEQYYAVTDLPMPTLFWRLDQAYPGSKFILTTRSEEKWLQSIRAHWLYELNPFRSQWDTDPFTHRIHYEMYGRKTFDETIFRTVYRQHNAVVKEYFKDRQDDLLVLDLEQESLWPSLCSFLGKPDPGMPFPRSNVNYRLSTVPD